MTEFNPNPNYAYSKTNEDEISLKDLILKTIEFYKELRRRFLILFLFAIIGLILSYAFHLYKSSQTRVTYTSSLSFTVIEGAASEGDKLIKNILGLNSAIPTNKITEILRSSRILNEMLLRKSMLDNNLDFNANHLIRKYNLNSKWKKFDIQNSRFSELALDSFFFKEKDPGLFGPKEFKALTIINKHLLNKIIKINSDRESGIFYLMITTVDDQLTNIILNDTYTSFTSFYDYQTVGRPKEYFKKLEKAEDSLYLKLKILESQIAFNEDRTKGILSKRTELKTKDTKRDYDATLHAYNQTRNNKERLISVLRYKTTEFEVLDKTFIPIKNITQSKKLNVLLFGLSIGTFFGFLYIISTKIIRDALN